MARKGLSNEVVCEAAAELIAEKGYRNFSMRELAARLGVAPSSLYEHVDGIKSVNTAVGMTAIDQLATALDRAIAVDDRDCALRGFAHAYRDFARDNPHLYQAIIGIPKADDEVLLDNESKTTAPLRKVVSRYVDDEIEIVNCERFVRAAIHGFVDLESAGFMRYRGVGHDESFEVLIDSCVEVLRKAGGR